MGISGRQRLQGPVDDRLEGVEGSFLGDWWVGLGAIEQIPTGDLRFCERMLRRISLYLIFIL